MKTLIIDMLTWMRQHYGCDPKRRIAKLKEEVEELQEAIMQEDEDAVREELADVLPPLLSLICIYQKLPQQMITAELQMMLTEVYCKMLNREKDPEWHRKHKHEKGYGDAI